MLKGLFCKHEWKRVKSKGGVVFDMLNDYEILYTLKCIKCGKVKDVKKLLAGGW